MSYPRRPATAPTPESPRGSVSYRIYRHHIKGWLGASYSSEVEVDMDFSGCFLYSQPLIPRGRCETVWCISTKYELLSQRWSQDMTISVSVTETAQTDAKTTLSGAFFSPEIKLEMVKHKARALHSYWNLSEAANMIGNSGPTPLLNNRDGCSV